MNSIRLFVLNELNYIHILTKDTNEICIKLGFQKKYIEF
jgi:hypothetical protein